MMRRGETVYRCAAALAAWALFGCDPGCAFALTRDDFTAPSTLSGRVDPYDWERQVEINAAVRSSLQSTPGWRKQGSAKTTAPSEDRNPAAQKSPATDSARNRPPTKAARRPRAVAPATRPEWQPPLPPSDAVGPPSASTTRGKSAATEREGPVAKPLPAGPQLSGPRLSGEPEQPAARDQQDIAAKQSPRAAAQRSEPRGSTPRNLSSSRRNQTSAAASQPAVAQQTPSAPQSSASLPPLTRQQQQLRNKIRRVLAHYYNRPLNTANRGPWELMHAMLSFEVHSRVLQGGPKGDPITAVGWLCFNQPCRKRSLMYINKDDELRVRVGPGLQGHHGQLLALLAQARVKSDYPMKVDGNDLTVADLIEMEKQTCYPRTELTFKLIGLMHYLDSEATWINDQGLEWDFRRLIREELAQPVRGAACGGTHRLSGLTLAYKKRQRRGEPVDGEYAQAKRFIRKYQNYAYRLQNPDGSLSTEWFRGPGKEDDVDRRLKTTGHTLEWLLYAAEPKQLTYWRTVKATNYLSNIMWSNRYRDWEAGPLGHAIHALVLYDRLVFSPHDGAGSIAAKRGGSRR